MGDRAGVRIARGVLARRVDDEAVVLDLESGRTYFLNDTAATTWSLLCEGASTEAIVARLAEEYDAETDQLRADVDAIIASFLDKGLLTAD